MKLREKKKIKRGEKNIITTAIKCVVFLLVLAIQLGIMYFVYSSEAYIEYYYKNAYQYVSFVITAVGIIYILYTHEKPEYKIPWIILLAFLPLFAFVMYLLYGKSKMNKRLKKERQDTLREAGSLLPNDEETLSELKVKDQMAYRRAEYIKNVTSYPLCKNEGIEYFDIGEAYFERLIEDIKKAEKYILIEYFIIARGKLWDKIYNVLKEKAANGVEVSVIADEWGSITRYPKHFFSECFKYGIEIYRYNPIRYGISNYMNFRDHRKIVVIDGVVAYTGGVNIADEYINAHQRFGHWKDNGVRMTGEVVKSFAISFLCNLEVASKTKIDYAWYINEIVNNYPKLKNNERGFVQYFPDGPDNRKNPGESAYVQILNTAKNYVYIYTPYFVVSDEVLNAILNAARSGLDVRIITPHKPDKWYVHITTRSYYKVLLEAGVKVYEYKPGFLHAKTMLADDTTCMIGTANLDFRSLNLNYECSVLTYDTGVEQNVKEDILDTMNKSTQITLDDVKNKNVFLKIVEAVLNAFATLM